MARQKELYADTLERIRKRADELFPNKLVYSQKEAAQILGKSPSYLSKRKIRGALTCEKLAWLMS